MRRDKIANTIFIVKQQYETMKNYSKIATLEPYLADIQRRNKIKSKLSKANKDKNQSSSRSFRIKDISTSSLHKLAFQKIDTEKKPGLQKYQSKLQKKKQTINTTVGLIHPKKIKPSKEPLVRQHKARSQQSRHLQSSFSNTIKTRQLNLTIKGQTSTIQNQHKQEVEERNNSFNDYLLRVNNQNKNKEHKLKFRKNLYEVALPSNKYFINQNSGSTQMNVKKISHTEINFDRTNYNNQKNENDYKNENTNQKHKKRQESAIMIGKTAQLTRKNNFRRGKYQIALHSSVQQKAQNQDLQPLQSERLGQLDKKQSNLSINQEMDIIAQKQMQRFYRQVRTKQIQKSLQKSTQKYFGSDSYRPTKSKNQIQLYVSSIINKISQSTYDNSDIRNKSPLDIKKHSDIYAYNFDFQPDKRVAENNLKINEIENPSQEQSNNFYDQQFQKQRKKAEIQYFHKDHPQLDWSEDDCQLDDI